MAWTAAGKRYESPLAAEYFVRARPAGERRRPASRSGACDAATGPPFGPAARILPLVVSAG